MSVGLRRSFSLGVVSLCALVGLLVLSAPALAAAPEAPAPVSVEGVKASEATLLGVLNPGKEGAAGTYELGTYEFLYAKSSTTCEGESRAPESPGISLGGGMEGVTQSVSGLEAGAEYTVCLLARNGVKGEDVLGPAVHFTTAFPFVEAPEAKPANPIAATEATLHGVLNPKSERTSEPGSDEFVYRQSTTECQRENPETGQKENEKTAAAEKAPEGHEGEAAEAKLSELSPGTTYTICLRVVNKAGEEQVSSPETFTTSAEAPTVEETYVTDVSSTSTTLVARINPGGAHTTYRFEYATETEYKPVPNGEGVVGEGTAGVLVSVHMQEGLAPGTTYHYRVVASNTRGSAPLTDHTFTTQAAGAGFTLPDGRQYELVSPVHKDGSEIMGIGGGEGDKLDRGGDATQASEDGKSVTYLADAPVEANPPSTAVGAQLFSRRGGVGAPSWSTQDISVPHQSSLNESIFYGFREYMQFSSDLSRAVLLPSKDTVEPPLAPEIHQEVSYSGHNPPEIYLRNDTTGVFQAVLTAEPLSEVDFEGATPDLGHIVFEGPAGLDPHYPGAGGLYEWADGRTQLVSVLPEDNPASGRSVLASALLIGVGGTIASPGSARHAVSDDGTRVVWTEAEESVSSTGPLFTRDMVTGETVQADAAEPGCGTCIGGGEFVGASSDGTRVFFTTTNELTSGAHEGGFYMFEVPTEQQPKGHLTDLTPAGTGAQMQTSFGSNEAGTSLYELSSAVLTPARNSRGQEAHEGESNLYLLREEPDRSWSTTFITTGAEGSPSHISPFELSGPQGAGEARPSPDGRYLAFMSKQGLTGYDNRDANSGEQDQEVYLYSAEANSLVCASCDPTGARPVGEHDTRSFPPSPMDPTSAWEGDWVAAVIPGATPAGFGGISTGYQPRFLSDSGRLFFDSASALVPRDVNGHVDVYQYEPAGLGSCQAPSYGQSARVVFDPAAGGCVGLISAGTGNTSSLFFDASANGNDVFFTTEDGLVSQDTDGASDMYDARVCTTSEPCPVSLAPSPPCTTPDSCRAAPTPEPGVFGAPSSATFSGAGNAPPPTVAKKITKKTAKCKKGFAKNKKGKCVKKPKKRSKRAKKAGHNGRAK
jgi:WD40-like Beta Propeller Repeat